MTDHKPPTLEELERWEHTYHNYGPFVSQQLPLRLINEVRRLQAENANLREALEAADSMVNSYEEGDLNGWEVQLYKRRRQKALGRETE